MPLRYFPIAGSASFTDDFGYERADGRGHAGIDIFAAEGTPLVAVDSGEVRFGTDPKGGNIASLRADDGTRYYYAHLSGFIGSSQRRVSAGEAIGYVGDTGNAAGTRPHLHFEMRPGGGEVVNPYPYLIRAPQAASLPARLLKLGLAVAVGGAILSILSPQTFRKLVS